MQVIGTQFKSSHQFGDFGWMLKQPTFQDALFVFNDNEEQYVEHRDHPTSPLGCADGGGNAAIRSYQCQNPPRAAGIPTGHSGQGYTSLVELTGDSGKSVQALIDEALATIQAIAAQQGYQRLFYSADTNGDLGSGIFQVGADIKKYAGEQLRGLAES